jgi:hypothetical protein
MLAVCIWGIKDGPLNTTYPHPRDNPFSSWILEPGEMSSIALHSESLQNEVEAVLGLASMVCALLSAPCPRTSTDDGKLREWQRGVVGELAQRMLAFFTKEDNDGDADYDEDEVDSVQVLPMKSYPGVDQPTEWAGQVEQLCEEACAQPPRFNSMSNMIYAGMGVCRHRFFHAHARTETLTYLLTHTYTHTHTRTRTPTHTRTHNPHTHTHRQPTRPPTHTHTHPHPHTPLGDSRSSSFSVLVQ